MLIRHYTSHSAIDVKNHHRKFWLPDTYLIGKAHLAHIYVPQSGIEVTICPTAMWPPSIRPGGVYSVHCTLLWYISSYESPWVHTIPFEKLRPNALGSDLPNSGGFLILGDLTSLPVTASNLILHRATNWVSVNWAGGRGKKKLAKWDSTLKCMAVSSLLAGICAQLSHSPTVYECTDYVYERKEKLWPYLGIMKLDCFYRELI